MQAGRAGRCGWQDGQQIPVSKEEEALLYNVLMTYFEVELVRLYKVYHRIYKGKHYLVVYFSGRYDTKRPQYMKAYIRLWCCRLSSKCIIPDFTDSVYVKKGGEWERVVDYGEVVGYWDLVYT